MVSAEDFPTERPARARIRAAVHGIREVLGPWCISAGSWGRKGWTACLGWSGWRSWRDWRIWSTWRGWGSSLARMERPSRFGRRTAIVATASLLATGGVLGLVLIMRGPSARVAPLAAGPGAERQAKASMPSPQPSPQPPPGATPPAAAGAAAPAGGTTGVTAGPGTSAVSGGEQGVAEVVAPSVREAPPPPPSPDGVRRGRLRSVRFESRAMLYSMPLPAARSGYGILSITAAPLGEKVFVNGIYYGNIPRELKVLAGRYTVHVTSSRWGEATRPVTVHSGKRSVVLTTLSRK